MTKKYIDANSLRKEIEKNKNMIDGLFTEGDDSVYDGENDAYNRVLRIIDSLQQEQPEVDLERDAVQFCFDKGLNITPYQAKTIASHFYELGKNSK